MQSGEERILVLTALLSCAYLCTKLGVGTIPNEIKEERNSRHMGRSELNSQVFQEAE
jgi:hypothetical protein